MRDLSVNNWVAYNKIDFLDRKGLPLFKVADVLNSNLLKADDDHVIPRNFVYLRRNDI